MICDDGGGGSRTAPTAPIKRKPLGRLIGAYKTVSTKQINILRDTPGLPVWQRNYGACPELVEGNMLFEMMTISTASTGTSNPIPRIGRKTNTDLLPRLADDKRAGVFVGPDGRRRQSERAGGRGRRDKNAAPDIHAGDDRGGRRHSGG